MSMAWFLCDASFCWRCLVLLTCVCFPFFFSLFLSNNAVWCKSLQSCGTCCSTNRTTAFLGLVKQALEISTATGLAPGDSFPNDPTTVTHPTRDSAWLFRMVREQYAIDPAWFLTPTLFPLDARDINITNNDGVREEYNAFFINEHWYRAVGGK